MKKPKNYISRGPIRAIQFTGENHEAVTDFLVGTGLTAIWTKDKIELRIISPLSGESVVTVNISDYIYMTNNFLGGMTEKCFKEIFKQYSSQPISPSKK